MENLAAKYRPKTLEELTEQSTVTQVLHNLCEQPDLKVRNFLFTGPAGTGKANSLDTNILTPDGYTKMGDIQIGDTVFTHNGVPAKVSGVYPQGSRHMYKLMLADGTSCKVSDNHLNLVVTEDNEGLIIDTSDLVVLMKHKKDPLYVMCPSVDFNYEPTTAPLDPLIVGFIVSSCHCVSDHPYLFKFDNSDFGTAEFRQELDRALRSYHYRLNLVDNTIEAVDIFDSTERYDLLFRFWKAILRGSRIPKGYLINSDKIRTRLLMGCLHTLSASVFKSPSYIVHTVESQDLSDDFAFLVRSLGGYDKVAKAGTSNTFIHTFRLPESSETLRRRITDIIDIGKCECQCIMVDHIDHSYIVNEFIPTHNTTLSRAVANILNEGKGEIIEIDAASHSGVDAMRSIVDQAHQYPVGCKYKVFILDECVTGDTEILTSEGFKRFDQLNKNELIAQYTDNRTIEFVQPSEYIEREYEGEMYRLHFRNGQNSVLMSPHHVQPQWMRETLHIKEDYIKDSAFNAHKMILAAGESVSDDYDNLHDFLKLRIAIALCGFHSDINVLNSDWMLDIRSDKILGRMMSLLDQLKIRYSVLHGKYRKYVLHIYSYSDDRFSSEFNLCDIGVIHSANYAKQLIDWILEVSGSRNNIFEHMNKEYVDYVSALAAQCGLAARQWNSAGLYHVKLYEKDCWSSRACYTTRERFCGKIYCVKVPSHMIIIRANGLTFVTGNCHAISSAGWQVLLKTLEEQPARTLMSLCTTNPEKIPATVLSRVQSFQLSKISLEGIYNRLKYIIEQENKEGAGITYEDDAVYYIAKLSNGGMRDSITNMEQCLSYNLHLSVENVVKALNLPNYDDYFLLLNAVAKKDNTAIVEIVDKIYNSGVNFIKWFDGFHAFICNIVKYIFMQDISATMIPSYYQDKISKYGPAHSTLCLLLANKLIKMNQELRNTQYLQELAITYLCTPPKKQ